MMTNTNNDEITAQVNRLAQAVTELAREISDIREENRDLAEASKVVCKTLQEIAHVIIMTMTAEPDETSADRQRRKDRAEDAEYSGRD